MKACGRLFNCARCYAQSMICRSCDRGHIYCSHVCAAMARRSHVKRAQRKYQSSHKGRLAAAERQRRFRARHRQPVELSESSKQAPATKKVTHHSSTTKPTPDSLPALSYQRQQQSMFRGSRRQYQGTTQYRCHYCGHWLDFLRTI